jgi:hypothetical protein
MFIDPTIAEAVRIGGEQDCLRDWIAPWPKRGQAENEIKTS